MEGKEGVLAGPSDIWVSNATRRMLLLRITAHHSIATQ
jgi:hypothetical protein